MPSADASTSGHAGVLELRHASNRSDRRLVLSSHYYLAHGDGRGLSFLQWHELEYDAAGWPRLGAPTSPMWLRTSKARGRLSRLGDFIHEPAPMPRFTAQPHTPLQATLEDANRASERERDPR